MAFNRPQSLGRRSVKGLRGLGRRNLNGLGAKDNVIYMDCEPGKKEFERSKRSRN